MEKHQGTNTAGRSLVLAVLRCRPFTFRDARFERVRSRCLYVWGRNAYEPAELSQQGGGGMGDGGFLLITLTDKLRVNNF